MVVVRMTLLQVVILNGTMTSGVFFAEDFLMEKKVYVIPKITVIKLKVSSRLMESSGEPVYYGPAASKESLDNLDRLV